MNKTNETKALKKQLMAAIAMVMVAAVALTSATYAWFISNTRVKAETATMTSKTAYTLLISEGAKASDGSSKWTTVHDWIDGKTSKELSPVSTLGTLENKQLEFAYDTAWKAADAVSGSEVVKGGNYANTFEKTTGTDKYIKESFEIKAAQNCQLILDSDTAIVGATGELDKVLRLGLVIDDGKAQTVRIYQVNKEAGTATPINTTLDTTSATADGIAKAISPSTLVVGDVTANKLDLAADKNAANGVADIMGTQSGNSILYTFNDIANTDTITVTAYIWMEGCDYDCNALETQQFKDENGALPVTASLSFSAALPN